LPPLLQTQLLRAKANKLALYLVRKPQLSIPRSPSRRALALALVLVLALAVVLALQAAVAQRLEPGQ